MPADNDPSTAPEDVDAQDVKAQDVKAKYKEALERKHGNESGVAQGHRGGPKVHDTHGPEGKRGYIRRKTG